MCPQFMDMEGWMLLSSDRQVVPHELQVEAGLLHADLQHLSETIPELYWQAPPSYLGDRVSGHFGPQGGAMSWEAWGLHEPTGPAQCCSRPLRRCWAYGEGLARSHSSVPSPGVILRGDPPL